MKTLRKAVDTAVLFLLYLVGSAVLALGDLGWRPVAMVLGHPPRRRAAEPESLPHVINSAFVFIGLSTIVGTWIVRHW